MTYLPGQPVVPCAVCGTPINRRGQPGVGHLKYCKDPTCRRTGELNQTRQHRGSQPRRADGVCPRCNINKRAERPDGRLRGWCRSCESAQKAEYMASPAGRATSRRWREKNRVSGPPVVPCAWCGSSIYRRELPGVGNQKYCNEACRQKSQTYHAILRSVRPRGEKT